MPGTFYTDNMKMRKKEMLRLLLACGLMISPLLGHAYADPKFVVQTTTGASYEFYITDNPQIRYQNNSLVLTNDKGLSVTVEAADVKGFKFFPSDETGIGSIKDNASFGSMMSGLRVGSKVEVVSLSAKILQSSTVGNDGAAKIDFTPLPKGVYIIKTEKGSFKITKN